MAGRPPRLLAPVTANIILHGERSPRWARKREKWVAGVGEGSAERPPKGRRCAPMLPARLSRALKKGRGVRTKAKRGRSLRSG